MSKYETSIEQALEEAAYRCDMETFRAFIDKVELALSMGEDTSALEAEIRSAIGKKRSSAFNIHKIANDPTTNLQGGTGTDII